MKHIIIGTAGHIDHGKTTLIRALTGRNTDRLKEEQKRGISIELGFTYFDLPRGQRAGIIDVPGHEKFVKNMLAGVIGIDIVILVVAADEGIMPQTIEHLAILDLLGIEKGFIVMTKTDLVENEWMELVEEEIKDEIKGTFLEGSPIIRVSSTKNRGLNEAIELLDEYSQDIGEKEINEMPRLPVDRSFLIPGFGTVVTGTLLSGSLKIGDEVQVYPGDKVGRIRTIQVHDQDTNIAYAGQRVATNIAGLKKEEVDRGSVIAPLDSMKETMMLDVKVKLLKSIDRPIENRTRIRLYIGTKEVLCRIVLLDREELQPGEEAFAQLRLEEKVAVKVRDKFIIRFYSPMFTIGGGQILDSNPTKKRRFDKDVLEQLRIKAEGSSKEILERIIEDASREFPSLRDIASHSSLTEENLRKEIGLLDKEGKVVSLALTNDIYYIHTNHYLFLKESIIKELANYHKKYPLRDGISKEEIRSKFLNKAKGRVGEILIDKFIEEGHLVQELETIKLKNHHISYNEEQEKIKENILRVLEENSFSPPKKQDLNQGTDVSKVDFNEVFNSLINRGEILRLSEEVFLREKEYKEALNILIAHIEKNGSISLGEYRDLLDTNRKISIALLEYFDQQKITKRDNDKRILY